MCSAFLCTALQNNPAVSMLNGIVLLHTKTKEAETVGEVLFVFFFLFSLGLISHHMQKALKCVKQIDLEGNCAGKT
ncbi:hypothetical protein Y032_0009g747 [Ancylostoma ceylanicum]|uniref:Uncharacterized protein n=1 Tax=Ancylostoma ceylanicum TaxID=53326 RepID=A0A016VL24_9BILA|nr:hypothetical protein Y032_0009g747 [Ancylostoma ceylanicum]